MLIRGRLQAKLAVFGSWPPSSGSDYSDGSDTFDSSNSKDCCDRSNSSDSSDGSHSSHSMDMAKMDEGGMEMEVA